MPLKPDVTLRAWSVFEVQLPGREPTRHLAGTCMETGEGQVSSAVQAFNASNGHCRTETGRTYLLDGRAGLSRHGMAKWAGWKALLRISQERDVTLEYTTLKGPHVAR